MKIETKKRLRITETDVRAITDVQALVDVIDQVGRDIEGIVAQLEFATEDQTVEWERRAKGALRHARAVHKLAVRRHKELINDPVVVANYNKNIAKSARKLAVTKLQEQKFQDRVARREQHLELQRISAEKGYAALFAKAARSFLTPEQIAECDRLARPQTTIEE